MGIVLAFLGIVLAIMYLWFDFRFTMPVLAVFSSFLETKMFVTFSTNFADELILLLLISGTGMIVFSKEKNESETLDSLRNRAWVKAIIVNNIFLIVSVLFVYGSGFMAVLIFNIFSVSVFYLCFFYLIEYRNREKWD